ncbi:ImmA/IrrE family metallo-endopeptidase [Oscillibacter sp. GMB15532]|uniref:ImmA/IrrE family metallo-endopeptidase n=1 Tax=Oscillibacter sp. GMB15532 TaxID=3230022 RepID=UPI0034DE3CAF
MLRSDIEKKANKIRDQYGMNQPPINVEDICRKMKISVDYIDMQEIEKRVGKDISGAIISRGDKSEIKINSRDIQSRQRFTIAHELGHKILHIANDSDDVIISFRCLKNNREREADAFAAELLMPRDMVKEEHGKLFYPLVSQLAETFRVSKAAMKNRLDELGLSYIG